MYFELYKDKSRDKLWRWRLMDGEDNLANSGQGFDTWNECMREIDRVKQYQYAAICTDPNWRRA